MEPSDYEDAAAESLRWLDGGRVAVTWQGGHESVYDRPFLRSKCPCATCKGTHGPATTLVETPKPSFNIRTGPKPPTVDVALKIVSAEPVGQYAIRITWGDGHNSGLYSYRYLRAICPCRLCNAGRTVG